MELDYYNMNANRSYPVVPGVIASTNLASRAIVDCGIVMGPDSGFVPATHHVKLARISKNADEKQVDLEFASNAPGMSGATIKGSASGDWPIGTIVELVAYIDGVANEALAFGWAALNSSEEIYAHSQADGWLDVDASIEPALVQGMNEAICTSIDAYSEERTTISLAPKTPHAIATGMTGNVVVGDGYSTEVIIEPSTNTIIISASPGSGEGFFDGWSYATGVQKCSDLIASISGVRASPQTGRINMSASNGLVITGLENTLHFSMGNTNMFCTDGETE